MVSSDHGPRVTRHLPASCVPETEGGPVEQATRADLAEMASSGPVSRSLAATALTLARALDQGAGLAVAAVARELRATLAALAGPAGGDPDDGTQEFFARMSTPVRHGPQIAPGDVRPKGGRSRRPAGD
jgi:hypothetical protein